MTTDNPAKAYRRLLSPISVRSMQLRNRVVVTAHGASDFFRDPTLSPDSYIEYLRRRAAGGVGLIIAQPLLVNPILDIPESTVERHARLAEVVKAEGAMLIIQLVHLGGYGRTESIVGRPPSWTFDEHQSDAGESSHRMSDDEIEQMIGAYRRAARMVANAGFEGVEVHGGHGYLVQQSLTPRTNQRDDRWGHDRTLFVRSVIGAVRDEIGPHRILCYRTSTNDLISQADGGRGPEGIAEDLGRILRPGTVDLLNTTMGDGGKSYISSIPGYRHPEAPNIDLIRHLRTFIDIDVPVIGVGGIVSAEVAEAVLESGACDLVAMTRAHIADPDLVNKVRGGAVSSIRPCVRANLCVDRKQALYPDMGCFHNPEVLREIPLAATPAASPKRVLVVGAGPAGLKAAEIAARRGHRVDLFDAAPTCGGQLSLTRHTAASELVKAVDFLVSEIETLGVRTHLRTRVDDALLQGIDADEIIVATGARARTGSAALDGGDTGVVISSEQALLSDLTGAVMVYDGTGTTEAALVAETLAARGCAVVFATKFETMMPFAGQMQRWEVPDLLHKKMRSIHVSVIVDHVDNDVVRLAHVSGQPLTDVSVEAVVAVVPPIPDRDLVPVLDRLNTPYRLVGDVNAPRSAWQAFNEGHLAALAL
jgi:2,4-dienoyl-CoA reductase-like NADH-dependent reductase (Old Yellow Enzyme family)/thioredoxin reductase